MTEQISEILRVGIKTYDLTNFPPIPEDHPRIAKGSDSGGFPSSSACSRGYRGVWEVKDGRFYLVKVDGKSNLVGAEPLFADWYSDKVWAVFGDVVNQEEAGLEDVYDGEFHAVVEKGVVVSTEVVRNRREPPFFRSIRLAAFAAGMFLTKNTASTYREGLVFYSILYSQRYDGSFALEEGTRNALDIDPSTVRSAELVLTGVEQGRPEAAVETALLLAHLETRFTSLLEDDAKEGVEWAKAWLKANAADAKVGKIPLMDWATGCARENWSSIRGALN